MAMTKGARRRNAYVSVVIDGFLLIASVMYAWPWWAIALFTVFFAGSLHDLATIGFTAIADNEQ